MTEADAINKNKDLLDGLPSVSGSYRKNGKIARNSWFQVGGPAEVLYKPASEGDLVHFMQNKPDGVAVTPLGVGSNLIIRDGGIEGVVLKLGRAFNYIHLIGDKLKVGGSVLNQNLASYCLDNSIKGFEFMSGIPGSIGPGIKMNAGAYGSEFKDLLISAKAIDYEGNLLHLSNSDIGFIYRGNSLKQPMIFIEATFKAERGGREAIKTRLEEIKQRRESTQPVKELTSGSTFKNPEGYSAWKLIDRAGLRGYKIGGAMFSEKHCNFMINLDGASAADLEALGEYARELVYKKFSISLEWEIERIGNSRL
jgi:UDP-N-acetylmuramate dehydrogenase